MIIVAVSKKDDEMLLVNYKSTQRRFEMDKVFSPSPTQSEVFKDVRSLVTSCLDGYNVCIFAYGQTGSGKTYTMEGSESSPGINEKALQLLFKESSESLDWDFTISVSFMEIYNEMLRDLLSVEPEAKLDIKQNKDGTKLSFSLLRSMILCIRGSRSLKRESINNDDMELLIKMLLKQCVIFVNFFNIRGYYFLYCFA